MSDLRTHLHDEFFQPQPASATLDNTRTSALGFCFTFSALPEKNCDSVVFLSSRDNCQSFLHQYEVLSLSSFFFFAEKSVPLCLIFSLLATMAADLRVLGGFVAGLLLCAALFSVLLSDRPALVAAVSHAPVGHATECVTTAAPATPLLRRSDISRLFEEKVRLPDDYFRKHERSWKAFVEEKPGAWHNRDVPRLFAVMDFRAWLAKYHLATPKRALATWPGDPEWEFVKPEVADIYSYDKRTESKDLHAMESVPNDAYDLIILGQTLEHVYSPFLVARNLHSKLKKGGYLFTSVPAVNQPHMTPVHFFHFQPMGLAVLFAQSGFEVVEMGQYGSFDYEKIVLGEHRWPDYREVDRDGVIRNDRNNPSQVWGLFRKR